MYDFSIVGGALVLEQCDNGRYTFEEAKVKLLDYLTSKYVKAAEANDGIDLVNMYW